jgi:hypothetical protein
LEALAECDQVFRFERPLDRGKEGPFFVSKVVARSVQRCPEQATRLGAGHRPTYLPQSVVNFLMGLRQPR